MYVPIDVPPTLRLLSRPAVGFCVPLCRSVLGVLFEFMTVDVGDGMRANLSSELSNCNVILPKSRGVASQLASLLFL